MRKTVQGKKEYIRTKYLKAKGLNFMDWWAQKIYGSYFAFVCQSFEELTTFIYAGLWLSKWSNITKKYLEKLQK